MRGYPQLDLPLLIVEEERTLATAARAGCRQSRDRLVLYNLRLAVSVAARYVRPGLALEDLVQEGIVGLYRAVYKFEPERGNRFSTYATWWIRQACQSLQDQCRSFRELVNGDKLPARESEEEALPMRAQVRQALDALCPRHRRVVVLRYGLEGEQLGTDAIADLLQVSRSRVGAILAGLLQKMRAALRPDAGLGVADARPSAKVTIRKDRPSRPCPASYNKP